MKKAFVILFLAAFCCGVAVSAPSLYAQTAQPVIDTAEVRAILEASIDDILGILSNPEAHALTTDAEIEAALEKEVYDIFDFTAFTAGVVGPRWRTFNAEEKQALTEAFTELLRATYLSQFESYDGEEILYLRESQKGKTVEVETVIRTQDKRQIPITYKLMLINDHWVVFDVVAEGMSLMQHYREQYQQALLKESAAQLVERIKDKVIQIRAKGGTV